MIYDLFFILISTCSLVGLILFARLYKLHKKQSVSKQFLNLLLTCIASFFIFWNSLLLFTPSGTSLHEILRLPRHFWMLNHDLGQIKHERIVYGNHSNQYCHIIHPSKQIKARNKIVFFIHGGGWRIGGPHQHHYLAKLLSNLGYTIVLPAYRLTPQYSYPHINQDISSALQTSLNYLDSLHQQKQNLIIGGVSAGANLAALLAFDKPRWDSIDYSRERLKGFFSLAGVLNLDLVSSNAALQSYAGPKEGSFFQKANPINYVDTSDHFKLLCIHGNKDGLCGLANAQSFYQKMKRTHPTSSTLYILDQGTHLDLGAGWYYHTASERGQKKVLLDWIQLL